MLPEAHTSHCTPHRVRIRIPSKKGDKAYFSSLRDQFASLKGIENLGVNATTGSVLFVLTSEPIDIAAYAEERNLFKMRESHQDHASVMQTLVESLSYLNSHVKTLTGGSLDGQSLAVLALFAVGLYQLSVGNVSAPAWYVAFWYALDILYKHSTRSGTG